MSVSRHPPDSPQEWLNRARSSLLQAKSKQEGVYLEDLCFDAQQAAEKAVKGLLIQENVAFPYVHDLAELLSLAQEAGQEIPESVKQASRLTRYAIASRYPSAIEPVTEEEYQEALAIARKVVRWVESAVRDKEPSDS